MEHLLHGKTVLITGATSGIGAATALRFAQAGAVLALTGRNASRGAEIEDTVARHGVKTRFIPGDLTDEAFCHRLVQETVKRFGRLDVLVNNAGIIHVGDVVETTDAQWRETMALNVNAVFYLCRATVRAMRRQGGGVIVNVASEWGLVGAAQTVAYCASKGAVVQMTRAMALDHARDNIRINAVCPGSVDTPMLDAEADARGMNRQEARSMWAAESPNSRLASAQNVADAILFLASDTAQHITGVLLPVDGGSTAR